MDKFKIGDWIKCTCGCEQTMRIIEVMNTRYKGLSREQLDYSIDFDLAESYDPFIVEKEEVKEDNVISY